MLTALYHNAGEMPSSFPQRRLQIDFSQVDMSPRLNRLLQGLLQPAWEDRLTATQAKAVLAGNASSSSQQSQRQRQQQKGWNIFNEGAWEDRRQRSRGSTSSSQVRLCSACLIWSVRSHSVEVCAFAAMH